VTDRHTVNTITSNALDQLYAERDEARLRAANAYGQRDRLRTRIAALAERWQLPGHLSMPQAATEIEEALNRESWAPWPDPIKQVLNACDQLERAVHNADGRLLTAYDRGVDTAIRRVRNALDQPTPGPAATEEAKTTRVLAALHRSAEQDVSRVIALYEQWVKAGPPPLGTLMARWWDARLVELHDAILGQPAQDVGPTVREAAANDRRWPLEKAGE
jgi:hypothetical protein